MSLEPDLSKLAEQYGLETSFLDSFGQNKVADAEALIQVLGCLGARIDSPAQAAAALAARKAELRARVLEPVNVVWEGEPALLRLRLGAGPDLIYRCELTFDNGERRELEGHSRDLPWLPVGANEEGLLPNRTLDLGPIPIGYHSLRFEVGGQAWTGALFSAPLHAYGTADARYFGVFAPTYALRSERDLGAGDLRELETLVDWIGARGGHTVGTLPLLPAFLSNPFDPSPYAPVSRLFWNEFYLDLDALPERRAPSVVELMGEASVLSEIRALRALDDVDYRRLAPLKRRVLERMSAHFFASGGDQQPEFRAYLSEPRVRDYAAFRATLERRKASWQTWPEGLKSGALTEADYRREDFEYYVYSQWRTSQQIKRLSDRARGYGLGLYLDLPVGVHASGYDLWAERESFLVGCGAGAPPDIVFQGGQDWGLAPLSPEGLRREGYRYFRDMIAHHLRVAGALRIDHVMGLHRIYCVPQGLGAKRGIYVRYKAEELYAVMTIESVRHRSLLVGEDLGTVPADVPPMMERHALRRMHVLEYALEADQLSFDGLVPTAVASINTHDLFPFASWWECEDIEDRKRQGVIDDAGVERARGKREWMKTQLIQRLTEEGRLEAEVTDVASILSAVLEKYGESPVPLVLATLEDGWLERRPQNVPGTGPDSPNWRRKMARTLEQVAADEALSEPYERLSRARARSLTPLK
jgi:4-alpha-glucanotransferase